MQLTFGSGLQWTLLVADYGLGQERGGQGRLQGAAAHLLNSPGVMRTAKRVGAIGMAAVLYHQLLSSVVPAPVQARVEPLTRITRQIHKPNMLIVLDTSGSLTGVP